jgi:predicted amidohydrolase YtcJ
VSGRAWSLAGGIALAIVSTCVTRTAAADPKPSVPLIFRGGTIIDGTGAPASRGDLMIRGDRIVGVGTFEIPADAKVIDATGLVVAPGFIDLHSHSDEPIVVEATRDNRNYQFQGVTTIVTGNCGGGALDVGKYFDAIEKHGAGANVIHLIPQGDVREAVLGKADRRADREALRAMARLVEKGMRDGAWGMSSGLIYVPSRYADLRELTALATIVAAHGGIYASHIRDEGPGLLKAIDEAIAVGNGARLPVHISHLKANGKANWGLSKDACEAIEAARKDGHRVTADQYPYVASSTSLGAMVVPDWALQGNAADFARIAADPVRGPKLREAITHELADKENGASLRIARFAKDPSINGLNLVEVSTRWGKTPLEVVLEIQTHGGAQAISFGMSEDDVRYVMARDYVATASDGSAHKPGADRPHPRAYGTFPRKIRYALDERVISLEEAIRSCTGLPASILALPDRGTIRVGNIADLVVFDPKTFRDVATWADSTRYATGVKYLLLNGVAAIAEGKPVPKSRPGRVLRLPKAGPADTIIRAGRVWTGDPANPRAEALAIRGGEIVAVGTAADVERFQGPKTERLVFPSGFAMPGLIDAHTHLENLGASLEEVDLRGVASLEEVAKRVKTRVDAVPGDGWIFGNSFDQSLWPGKEFADASVLDKVAPRRPVWLRRVDGHAGWANSEAMRRSKVTKDTPVPSDGQVLRDKDGNPTGVFIDGAMGLVSHAIPPASPADIARHLLAGQAEVARWGITGIHDAGLSKAEIDAFLRLDREGKLATRVYGMASPPAGGEVAFVSRPVPHAWQGRLFHVRSIKLFIDGAMGSRGALLFEPYSDDPKNLGLRLIDPKVLLETTTAALEHGWQVNTHATGDKGNALALDAYAQALKAVPSARQPRLRIEHAQVVRRADVARFKDLGVIASMQPSHASDDMRWADARLGPGRVDGAYAWRWFLDAGVPLAFGSDFPVEVVNPFYGLYAAVTRQDESGNPRGGWHPDQRLLIEEALRHFTAGSAFAAFEEEKVGVLKVGMRADITVVDRDLLAAKPLDVLHARVLATIVDGKTSFSAK